MHSKPRISDDFQVMLDLAAGRQPRLTRSFGELLPLAEHHRLAVMLSQYYPEELEARQYGIRAAGREARLGAVQLQLVGRLHEKGVRAWAYKGPLLGKRLRLKAPRESDDIDILVHRDDYEAAEAVVGEGREKLQTYPWRTGPKDDRLSLVKESTFIGNGNEPDVELHWSLFARCIRGSMDERVWEQLGGNEDIDDALLFCILAQHAAYHGMCRLRWAADLVALNQLSPSAVRLAQEIASKCGSRTMVDSAVRFLDEVLYIQSEHDNLAPASSGLVNMWHKFLASENMGDSNKWENTRNTWTGCRNPASKAHLVLCILVEQVRKRGYALRHRAQPY